MASWIELSGVVKDNQADYLSELLQAEGAVAVSLLPVNEQLLVREELSSNELWSRVEVKGLFPLSIDRDVVVENISTVENQFSKIKWEFGSVADLDWVRQTQSQFPPTLISDRLLICPEGEVAQPKPHHSVLAINPGLAFGTGAHPTTNLCLEWLCKANLLGKSVLDYGCGSGILACAAIVLGAREVVGVDHDEQAIEASKSNAELNKNILACNIEWFLAADYVASPVDIVIANIIAAPLKRLKEVFASVLNPGGVCVLSGLLAADLDSVLAVYSPAFMLHERVQQGDWLRLVLIRA